MHSENCLTRVVILLQVQQLSKQLTEREDELLLLKRSLTAAADQRERIREASQHWREVKCEIFTINIALQTLPVFLSSIQSHNMSCPWYDLRESTRAVKVLLICAHEM